MIDHKAVRAAHVKKLAALGFRVSPGLPLDHGSAVTLDPGRTARRLLTLKLLFGYVAMPTQALTTERIQASISTNKLGSHFTKSERQIMTTKREDAQATHMDAIGWRLENMVALAWIFGSEILPAIGLEMCGGELCKKLLFEDSPGVDGKIDEWAAKRTCRDVDAVVAMEDFYYCWHNAARNIRFSGSPNPTQLDPTVLVGLIQERRHALTFSISATSWDDTELGT
jgi:hypothetical protein